MYLMRDDAQAPACELLPTVATRNPEPRFQDEFAAVEVAQFFFVRAPDFFRFSAIIKRPTAKH